MVPATFRFPAKKASDFQTAPEKSAGARENLQEKQKNGKKWGRKWINGNI
jgi:hypothetical protein